MCGRSPDPASRAGGRTAGRRLAPLAAGVLGGLAVCSAAGPARADGLWDAVLEKMNVKAAPAAPGPDFVERTRPDPSGLGYLPTALPHKVSPLAVKTPDQIQAEKDALDLAKKRQLDPAAGKPVQVAGPAAGGPARGAAGGAAGAKAGAKPRVKPAAVAD